MTDLVPTELPIDLATRTPAAVKDWLAHVQEMLREVLVDGVDYGTIPKVDKPILLKPGAEKLALLANLTTDVERVAWEPGPFGDMGATYRATAVVGERRVQVERYAGYDESQFLSLSSDGRTVYRREKWNTVISMAQKRAYVAAVKMALGLSGLFADLERGEEVAEAPAPTGTAPATGGPARGSRQPLERGRRRDEVPAEVYDNLPEANMGRPFE